MRQDGYTYSTDPQFQDTWSKGAVWGTHFKYAVPNAMPPLAFASGLVFGTRMLFFGGIMQDNNINGLVYILNALSLIHI